MRLPAAPFVLQASVDPDRLRGYAAELAAVQGLLAQPLDLHPRVTFLVGENGSGKSTIVEAIAGAAGLNEESGGRIARFRTRASHSHLDEAIVLEQAERPMNGFFLRAESLYNYATALEEGPDEWRFEHAAFTTPLHEQSHGESFLAVALERFGPRGLYVLDEPEAALSLQGQLALLRHVHQLVDAHCQFIIATHSPILLAYPDATIYEVTSDGLVVRDYEDTEQYRLTRAFLDDHRRFLHHLLNEDDSG